MGLRRLLATTDFSARSELAVKRASLLCGQFAAELHLLHLVDDDQPADVVGQETRQATSLLQAMAAKVAGLQTSPGNPREFRSVVANFCVLAERVESRDSTYNFDLLPLIGKASRATPHFAPHLQRH